jgi:hypothetical protein
MTKVSDMIGDFAHPAGEGGRDVAQDLAESVAGEMRELLDVIYKFNCVCDPDVMIAAWDYLNAGERAAWARVVYARGRGAAE